MAADFEISSLSGTGTATIRVKPKAVNEDMDNIKEQVLKVVVRGVEREVTLVQKAAPKIVETWGTYFSITPETTSHTFDGTKSGEILEIGVYSYQQKFINNEPQDEYRAVDWKVESTVDWLTVTKEAGELNKLGRVTIKTKSSNNEFSGTDADPIERTGLVRITQNIDAEPTKEISITQGKGRISFHLKIDGNGTNIGGVRVHEGNKDVTIDVTIEKWINSRIVKSYSAMIKIPTLGQRKDYSGTSSVAGSSLTYSGQGWVQNPGIIISNWVGHTTLSCYFKANGNSKFDQIIQQMTGAYPSWPVEIDPSRLPPGATLSDIEGVKMFYFFT